MVKKAIVDSVFNDVHPTWSKDKKKIPPKTFFEKLKESTLVSFTLSLPIESMKYYPSVYAVYFGTIAYCVMITVFVYFMVGGYQRQIQQEFISLDENAGVCEPVAQFLNLEITATSKGLWNTDPNFKYSEASLEFSFNKLSASPSEFKAMIQEFGQKLRVLGARSAISPFVPNMLLWMHFGTDTTVGESVQSLVFTAMPNDVYNHRHIVTTVGSANGICTAPSTSSFDVISSTLSIEWNVPTYYEAGCTSTVTNLESLGWEARDGNTSVIKLDVNSASTAVAANLGIFPADSLEVLGLQIPIYKDIVMTKRFDPFFPRMTPIICLQKMGHGETITENADKNTFNASSADAERAYQLFPEGGDPICFVDFNGQLGIPAVHHYLPGCMTCDGNRRYEKYNNDNYCDVFDVMLGIYYYPGVNKWTEAVELYYNYSSFAELSKDTFYPLYDMSNGVENATSYEFCNGCKLLGANVWDQNAYLSPQFLTLPAAHCVDSFSLTDAALAQLYENPPVRLVEPYFRCKMSPWNAFISSVGIAAGNLGAFGPIAIICIILPTLYFYFKFADEEPPKQKYDLVKIMKAQREFIEKVLGANDGTLEGISEDSVFHKLGVELYNLAQFEEGKNEADSLVEDGAIVTMKPQSGDGDINKVSPYSKDI